MGKRIRRLLSGDKSYTLWPSARVKISALIFAGIAVASAVFALNGSERYGQNANPDYAYTPAHADVVAPGPTFYLKSGKKVELIVSDARSGKSWTADGAPAPYEYGLERVPLMAGSTVPLLRLVVRVSSTSPYRNPPPEGHFEVPAAPSLSAPIEDGPRGGADFKTWDFTSAGRVPDSLGSANVLFAFADGPWRTVGTIYPGSGRTEGVRFAPSVSVDSGVLCIRPRIPTDVKRVNYQLVVYDRHGEPLRSHGNVLLPNHVDRQYFYGNELGEWSPERQAAWDRLHRGYERPLKVSDASRIDLQTRPYLWIEFPNVPLRP